MIDRPSALDRILIGLLTIIAALLAVVSVELWNLTPAMLPAASAQIPDTGRQRKDILDATRETNQLLADILNHLRNNPIKVEWVRPDKDGGGAAPGRRPAP